MQEIGICRKWEKIGNQKKKEIQKIRKAEKRKSEKVGNLKMQEIGISQKWEKVGNQKKKEIQKSIKAEKKEIRESRKSEKIGN